MKTPSLKSLVSLLLAGALATSLAGCGPEGPTEDEDTSSASGALTRATAVASVDAVAVESTVKVRRAAPTATVAPATVAAVATTDLERNHPWVVHISGTGGLNCRGTLIHPLWVATAAHCIGNLAGTVSFSRTDPATGVVTGDSRPFNQNGPSRGMFVHPEFDPDTGFGQPKNDIALIRLASAFNIDRNIQTAALPRFFANAGRVGTIVTNNHSSAPAGSVSVVRAPQLTDAECTAPDGFLCISPPAGSLCHGDSGSGYVQILDGRATLVGVTSNIDGGDNCIAASKQAQMVDVFQFRDWIYATMGMSPEQVDGRVRLRWSGFTSSPGIMSLQCLSAPTTPAIEASMNVPGSEIAMDCDDARVFCQPQGSNLILGGFSVRTFAANGAFLGTTALPFLPGFTAAFANPGSSFMAHTCSVYNQLSPTVNTSGAVLAKSL
jgi:integrin beta 3